MEHWLSQPFSDRSARIAHLRAALAHACRDRARRRSAAERRPPSSAPHASCRAAPRVPLQPPPRSKFDVALQLKDPAGAAALERAVTDPGSASYRRYVSPAQWEQRFGPTQATVERVTSWLSCRGRQRRRRLSRPHDRRSERAGIGARARPSHEPRGVFGRRPHAPPGVRLLSVPANLAGTILAISGVDQKAFRPAGFGKPGSEAAARVSPNRARIPRSRSSKHPNGR